MKHFSRTTLAGSGVGLAVGAVTLMSSLAAVDSKVTLVESVTEQSSSREGPPDGNAFAISEAAKTLKCDSGFLSIGEADHFVPTEPLKSSMRETPQSIAEAYAADAQLTPDRKNGQPPTPSRVKYNTAEPETSSRARVDIVDGAGTVKGVIIMQKLQGVGWVLTENAACSPTAPGPLEFVAPGDDVNGNRIDPPTDE